MLSKQVYIPVDNLKAKTDKRR